MNDEASIERIVERVLSRLGERGGGEPNLDGNTCNGCSVPGQCASQCPETTATILRQGADRISNLEGGADSVPGDISGMIDHTILKPNATRAEVEKLVAEAKKHSFASVCVNPCWVKLCREALFDTKVMVCTVAGFPLGACATETKAFETRRACYDGAQEIDMVINIGALKSGDDVFVERDVRAVVESAGPRAVVKVILENTYLDRDEIIRACQACMRAKAGFVKTSTGFGPTGATVDDVRLMRQVVGPSMGVKAAGGIRTRDDAEEMIRAGASRIGASASVAIVKGE